MADKTIDEILEEEASAPPTIDELFDEAAKSPDYQPYAGESRAANIAFRDLTLGLGPRIEAAVETGSISSPEYEAARDRNVARNDAYSHDNPGTALAASLAGGVPSAFIPGFGAARVGRAAVQGAAGVSSNLTRGQRALRAIGVGGEVGGVGHEAGLLGAKFAGAYGGLGSRENTIEGRLGDAAHAAPIGYAFGRGANAIMGPAVGVSDYADTVRRVGSNADMGARSALRRAIERDGTTVSDLRRQVFPDMGARHTSDDAIEAAMMAYDPAAGRGNVAAMRAPYQSALQRSGINLADSTVDTHLQRIRSLVDDADTTVPLNLPEVARRAGTPAQNLSWTQRVAASTPGESRNRLFDTVTGRQNTILDTVRNFTDRRLGGADLEGTFDDLVTRNRVNERAFYGFAKSNEKPIDLRTFSEGKGRAVAPTFANVDDRITYEKALRIISNNDQPHTLETFISANSALNDMIGASMQQRMGREVSTSVTAPLIELKKEAQKIVARSNPDWRVANDITAGGRGIEGLIQEIDRIPSSALLQGRGGKARRMIKRISGIRDELSRLSTRSGEMLSGLGPQDQIRYALLRDQAEAADVAIARAMHDVIDGLGDTHDISKIFMKGGRSENAGPKQAITDLLGQSRSAELKDLVGRAQMASTTYKNQFNSQTNPLQTTRDELDAEGKVAGFARILGMIGSPSEMLKEVSLMAARRFNEDRNRRLGDYYSTMTDDPASFLRMLREIESDDVARSPLFSREGANAYSGPAATGGAFGIGAVEDEQAYRQRHGY